jgi:hypothetical protein
MTSGQIHFFGLDQWWETTFTPEERHFIRSKYGESVDCGDDFLSPRSPLEFLGNLASWFKKDEERAMAYRMLDQAEAFFDLESSVLTKHFFLQNCIEVYYRGRSETPSRLPDAIRSCERQIAMAPEAAKAFRDEYPYDDSLPEHVGYKQLCIILAGEQTTRSIELARQALDAGWAGDWERRIERMSINQEA